MPFTLDTLAGLELAKEDPLSGQWWGRRSRDRCLCCLLWFLAGRKACEWWKGLPVASDPSGLPGLCFFLFHRSFLFSSQLHSLVGCAENQRREKVIEVLRKLFGGGAAGSKGEQLRSYVIQLCGEEFSMNIMINFLIIRSLRRRSSSPRGSGGNPHCLVISN